MYFTLADKRIIFTSSSDGLPSLTQEWPQQHLRQSKEKSVSSDELHIPVYGAPGSIDLPLGEGCASQCQALPTAPSLDTVSLFHFLNYYCYFLYFLFLPFCR